MLSVVLECQLGTYIDVLSPAGRAPVPSIHMERRDGWESQDGGPRQHQRESPPARQPTNQPASPCDLASDAGRAWVPPAAVLLRWALVLRAGPAGRPCGPPRPRSWQSGSATGLESSGLFRQAPGPPNPSQRQGRGARGGGPRSNQIFASGSLTPHHPTSTLCSHLRNRLPAQQRPQPPQSIFFSYPPSQAPPAPPTTPPTSPCVRHLPAAAATAAAAPAAPIDHSLAYTPHPKQR